MYINALKVIAIAAAIAIAMTVLRLLLIEPDEVAVSCLRQPGQWSCMLRDLLILGFVHHGYGYVSLLAAVIAGWRGYRLLAILAMISGMMGVVLYDFEWAAPGLLLGSLSLMRSLAKRTFAVQQAATE